MGWLTVTAHRESLRLLRDKQRETSMEMADLPETMVEPDHFEERAARDEARAVVNRAVAALPARQRALIEVLLAEAPPSYGEIAEELAIPVGSIGPTRGRALEKLRRDPDVAEALEALL